MSDCEEGIAREVDKAIIKTIAVILAEHLPLFYEDVKICSVSGLDMIDPFLVFDIKVDDQMYAYSLSAGTLREI